MKNSDKKNNIYTTLRDSILSWKYELGEMLPPEEELAISFGVARGTLRNALAELEKENLIVRIKRKGTFISENIARPKLTFLLPCVDALSGNNKFVSEIFYGALEASHELNCEIETRVVSPTNNPEDIDWKRLFNLNSSSKVLIFGYWFEPILPFLKEKNCQVSFIYDKNIYDKHDDKITENWHKLEKNLVETGINMAKELVSRGVKRPLFISEWTSNRVPFNIYYKHVCDVYENANISEVKYLHVEDSSYFEKLKQVVKDEQIDGILSLSSEENIQFIYENFKDIPIGIFDLKQRNYDIKDKNVFYSIYNYREIAKRAVELLLKNDKEIKTEKFVAKILNSL